MRQLGRCLFGRDKICVLAYSNEIVHVIEMYVCTNYELDYFVFQAGEPPEIPIALKNIDYRHRHQF